jgi:hypothetical protein
MIPITVLISAEDCCYQNKRIEEIWGGGGQWTFASRRKESKWTLIKICQKEFRMIGLSPDAPLSTATTVFFG